MAITIYSSGGTLKYTLNAIQASRLHQCLNGECTFDFSMPGRLISGIAIGDQVRLGDLWFNVCRVAKQTQVSGVAVTVSCEHVSYELADIAQDAAHFSGTPAAVLATILTGTGFSVGTVEVTGTWSITINQATNKRNALQQWATACNAELSYTGKSINFFAHVGSSTPVILSDRENVRGLGVTLDNRSDTQTYAVELSRLQHVGLGDAVTIQYTSLDLYVTTRILSLDYDPFHAWNISMTTGDHIPNFTGAVSAALEARLKEGQPYFGVTIDRENGIKIERSDGASEAIFNSDVFAMRAEIDGVMRDRIYFDPLKGDYVFDGALGADAVFTDSLYAEQGDIAELTVDRLSTSKRVRLYNLQNTSDDNYIMIQDNYLKFMTGTVIEDENDPGTYLTEQATNRYNQGLYWQREPDSYNAQGYPLDEDGAQIYATTDVTDWPVMVYQYDELVKAQFAFESESGTYVPILTLGAGDENGRNKGFIHKSADGLDITYIPTAGGSIGLYALASGYLELHGVRRATDLDLTSFLLGYFQVTMDGNVAVNYGVDFDASGNPVRIYDSTHSMDVTWW